MKKCTKCGEIKPRTEFSKHGNGIYPSCKVCVNKYNQEYLKRPEVIKYRQNYYRIHADKYKGCKDRYRKKLKKEQPWKLIFWAIKGRCNHPNPRGNYYKYGIKCLITEKELKELWFRDNASLLKKPSIDRIVENGHYTYGNCQWIELTENTSKYRKFLKSS